uniref:Timeless circadian regulator n=1 Tax=Pelodiscus sinensis TaxID=13735 RepID=K7F5Z5_PELSI
MMNCELLATCSALGYLEGDVYHKEPDCLGTARRALAPVGSGGGTHAHVHAALGSYQRRQMQAIRVVPQSGTLGPPTWDRCLGLMVNLTQPALLCFGKVPHDPSSRHCFLQVVSYLQAYKEAFASEKVFGTLSEKLYDLLQLDWEQRQEEDNLLIERLLLLVRNVLHIPTDPEEEKSVDDDASTHDRVLWAMHISGTDDLLKFLASSPAEQQWGLHVLEIVSLMFRDQGSDPSACTHAPHSLVQGDRKSRVLQRGSREISMMHRLCRKSRVLQRGSRHSRFGGSYVVQGLKSLGDRDLVFHKGLHNVSVWPSPRPSGWGWGAEEGARPQRRSDSSVAAPSWPEAAWIPRPLPLGLRRAGLVWEPGLVGPTTEAPETPRWGSLPGRGCPPLALSVCPGEGGTLPSLTWAWPGAWPCVTLGGHLWGGCLGKGRCPQGWGGPRPRWEGPATPTDVSPARGGLFCDPSLGRAGSGPACRALNHPGCLLPPSPARARAVCEAGMGGQPRGKEAAPLEASWAWWHRVPVILVSGTRRASGEPGEEEEGEEDEEEEELASVQVSEKEFPTVGWGGRFASTSVVKAYVLLLRSYRQNSAHTNHCVAKMLHRIAYDLKMEALLFQLSVFCLFQRLLSDPSAAAYKELVIFAKYILGKFFALAATNKKAYVELLFWKSTATVREMTEGYSSLREGEGAGARRASKWTQQEEEELQELYLKYKGVEGTGCSNAPPGPQGSAPRPPRRRRRGGQRLCLASKSPDGPRKGTRLVLWTEEQEQELQRLFEEFRDADDILGNIMRHLTAKRSKARVVEKLLSLGLVAERKELYKKRKRKPGLPDVGEDRSPWGAAGQEDSAEDEESDSEGEEGEAWEEG